jgi:dephospho-CoA kinase
LIRKLLEKISEISAGVVVIDAALIFDWPQVYKRVDYPILVVADDKVKEHRVSQKGIDEELFRQISNSQRDENETAPMAKFIIKNNGTLAKLKEECEKIYQEAKDDC